MRGKENLPGRDELSSSGRYRAECGMDRQSLKEGKVSRALYCLTVQLWYLPPMLARLKFTVPLSRSGTPATAG